MDVAQRARTESLEALKRLKTPMLDKGAECQLHERGNTFDGKQARKAGRS